VNRERILKRLEEIERRVMKTTPGPWEAKSGYVESDNGCTLVGAGKPIAFFYRRITPGGTFLHRRDCEFVASAREDMLWLRQIVWELLAQYVAMQEPLEWLASIEECGDGFIVGDPVNEEHAKHCPECQAILAARKALQSNIGRDLLDHLCKLEKVAEAARRVQLLLHRQFEWQTLEREMPGLLGAMMDLGKALRALEEVNDESRDPQAARRD